MKIIPSNNEVRLLDISPTPNLNYFNPQTFPNGRILFDFATAAQDNKAIFLHDFEPFRKTFIILAVGSYEAGQDYSSILDNLKKLYPSSIVHNLILFDSPDLLKSKNPNVFFHDGTENKLTALETIMCDISRNFLIALDSYASSYTNITLRSPVNIQNSHVLANTIHQAQKRLSSGTTSFKVSFTSSANNSPGGVLDSKSKSHQRHTGRQSKLMGNFYLLAGKHHDALQSFSEALVNLKKCDDWLWLGSALEGLAISCTLLQFIGSPYQLNNQALVAALQVPKSKLQTITSGSESTSPNRVSTEITGISSASVNGFGSTLASPQGAPATLSPRPGPRGSIQSPYSPRNSSSSTASFNFSSAVPDLTVLPLPECIKIISSRVLHFYHLSTSDYENLVPDIVYVESILRIIKYMIVIYLSGSDSASKTLENIVKASKISNPLVDNKHFSKGDIMAEFDRIFSLQLIDLDIVDQCRIYCSLAASYTDLGLLRKRAFILRTLLVCVLPNLEQSTEALADLTSLTESKDRISSIREIFEYLFTIYNLDKETESSKLDASNNSQSNWTSLQIQLIKLCLRITEAVKDYLFNLKLCTLLLTRYTHCLPTDDQNKLKAKVDNLLYLSNRENLNLISPYWDPFLVRNVKLISSKTKDELVPFTEEATAKSSTTFEPPSTAALPGKEKLLIKDETYQLKVVLQNPFAFDLEINDFTIVTTGVQVQTLKHMIKPLGMVVSFSPTAATRPANNKSRSVTKTSTPVLSVSYSSTNSLVIPSNSTEQFLIAFKPLSQGDLVIQGFNIIIENCEEQYFQIIGNEEFGHLLKLKAIGVDHKAVKTVKTLDTIKKNLIENNVSDRATVKTLLLKVVNPQPSLSLTDILVTNGWIMLLEGETHPFSISLTNHSDVLINYLSFSFWDSTIEPLNKRLVASVGNQVLPASEIYEIEWNLFKFKPFTILNKDVIAEKYTKILPKSDIDIDYMITAKRGMNQLKIILEYAHKSEDVSMCFLKHVNVPLNLTVVTSLEIVGCDIVPLFQSSLRGFEGDENSLHHENLENVLKFISEMNNNPDEDISDYCLLILDLRNSWSEKLSSKLRCNVTRTRTFEIDEVIELGKTSRFLLPIKRVSNEDIDLTQPIPSLRKRQFVKNYSVTEKEELKLREAFWLRNHLLDNLFGTWDTVNADRERTGNIELRSIRLTPKMENILVHGPIKLHTTIISEENQLVSNNGENYSIKIDQFYCIRTTIENHSDSTIKGILRHVPFPTNQGNIQSPLQTSIEKKILINGLMQTHVGKTGIPAGESLQLDLSFTILEKGEYEWGLVLDVLSKDGLQIVGREPIHISAS